MQTGREDLKPPGRHLPGLQLPASPNPDAATRMETSELKTGTGCLLGDTILAEISIEQLHMDSGLPYRVVLRLKKRGESCLALFLVGRLIGQEVCTGGPRLVTL